MKTKLALFAILTLGLTSMAQAAADLTKLPAALPEFMDKQQLAKWTTDQEAASKTTSIQDGSSQFYTGRPYVADAGGYIYKYRTYNPDMSRWTSQDPSGFPDGPNTYRYYPNPMSGFDFGGCFASGYGASGEGLITAGVAGVAAGLTEINVGIGTFAFAGWTGVGAAAALGTIMSGAAVLEAGTGGVNAGVVLVNQAFADKTTWISSGGSSNFTTINNVNANAVSFDAGVLAGYISYVTNAANILAANGHPDLASGFNSAAALMSSGSMAELNAAADTLNNERAFIPDNDPIKGSGFE